jgi:ADP-heptose:LPS heptosyltransferase
MASRARTRALVLARAAMNLALTAGRRRKPSAPQRILIAHHLLLGDTVMLTPLIAKLRAIHPSAEIVMTVPKTFVRLYERRPYDVIARAFDPRDPATLRKLFGDTGFDIAFIPGDNRHSWLAAALDARWIVAHAADQPVYKNWPVDEAIPYPASPAAWGDMVAALVDGPPPRCYQTRDWQAPSFTAFDLPRQPYAVLHVGASSPLRLWNSEKWRTVAEALTRRGQQVVWSGGRGEARIVREIDPEGRYSSYAERLDLPQLWQLFRHADLLVCPDTGVSHLARVVGTRTVTLFGPGSAVLFGPGEFWREAPFRSVTIPDFPCRDERVLFRRQVIWVRRCRRGLAECPAPRCMHAIEVNMALAAVDELLAAPLAGANAALAP